MGLNMMGLGFAFGGKDQGLLDLQGKVGDGFESIGGKLGNLMDISSKFTSTGMNLTTSLEAFRVKSDQAARAMVANAGYTGEASRKMRRQAVAMAEGLNISADAATRATIAAERNQEVVQALSVDAKDLAKFQQVTGSSAIELTEAFGRLRGEMGVSDKGLKEFESALISSGSATRDIGGQVKFLTDATQFLSRKFALGEKDITKYGKGVLAASAGFMPFVATTNEARELALKLTENLIQGQEQFQGLMAGTGKDLDTFTQELAVMNMDVGKAFEMMQESPSDFIQSLVKAGAEAQDKGLLGDRTISFLRARLEKALDPDLAAVLINVMKGGTEAAKTFAGSLDGMPTTIKEINKAGFTTGRTLNEQFLLAQERMIATFRGIGREAARDFVKGARKDFREFGKDLREMANDDGPMGMVVNKMSEMHQIGAMALVPESLRPTTSAFATMATQLIPVVDNLNQLGISMNSFSGVATGAATALGFTWFRLKQNEAQLRRQAKAQGKAVDMQKIHEMAIKKTSTEISGFLKDAGQKILEFVQGAPVIFKQLGAIYDELDETFKQIWTAIKPPLYKYVGKAVTFAKEVLIDTWDGMMAAFEGKAIGDEASTSMKVGASIGRALDGALEKAFEMAGVVLGKLWNKLKAKMWDKVKGLAPSLISAAGSSLAAVASPSGLVSGIGGALGSLMSSTGGSTEDRPKPAAKTRSVKAPPITGGREASAQLLDSVNHPEWFYQSYQPVFTAMMRELISAVQASSVARGAPTPTPATGGGVSGNPYSTRTGFAGNGSPLSGG